MLALFSFFISLALNPSFYPFKIEGNHDMKREGEKMDKAEREIDIELKNIKMEQNKELGYLDISIEAYAIASTEVEQRKVGEAVLNIYDENWGNVVEFADEHSSTRLDMITSVCFKECEEQYGFVPIDEPSHDLHRRIVYGRLAILDNFTIFKEFQNQGYGTEFMKELLSFLTHILNVHFILLQAQPYIQSFPHQGEQLTPFQINENRKYINKYKQKLFYYYHERFGFQPTGNPELNFMVFKTNNISFLQDMRRWISDEDITA
ncbi:hypothetical protein CVD28_02160 [Bacillus sp. M6-12]|uniref:hypothetical protein n=1 Tax=Bacillus sp. M6-12 TaxID=2054166 RepID=UPI000C774CC0|nr:hypothetical protein [Bacillus sp. M6-12]PLS19236.1 hypothetical protein CVD28_02160 [Bacillus sp. M6-12]